jgi:flagellin
MSNSINTNPAASYASTNLNKSAALLQKSLLKLSSGSRIVETSDDAGGMAVSMRLKAALSRTDAVASNISNAISMLQTQASSLANFSAVVSRMSELAVRIKDATQNTTDLENYFSEYSVLRDELDKIDDDKFNGVALFGGGTLSVHVREDGTFSQSVDLFDLNDPDLATVRLNAGATYATVKALSGDDYTAAIQKLATYTAKVGASISELEHALDRNRNMKINLEQADSRIADVDVAAETTRLAKSKVLVDAGSAALKQANQSKDSLVKLLG